MNHHLNTYMDKIDITRCKILSLRDSAKGIKGNKEEIEFPALKKRIPTLWTHSKFISSVGSVTLYVVKRYIEEQKHV